MTSPKPHLRLVSGSRPNDADASTDGEPHVTDRVERSHARLDRVSLDDDATDDVDPPPDGDEPAPARVSARQVVLVGVAFQAMGVLSFATRYASLSRDQAVSPAAALLSVPGVIALYAGALFLARRPGRGRTPFLVAAIALGLAVPFWGVAAAWTWPIALGAMLGLAGAWLARTPDSELDPEAQDAWDHAEPPGSQAPERDRYLH